MTMQCRFTTCLYLTYNPKKILIEVGLIGKVVQIAWVLVDVSYRDSDTSATFGSLILILDL